jgi:hypothetical protein
MALPHWSEAMHTPYVRRAWQNAPAWISRSEWLLQMLHPYCSLPLHRRDAEPIPAWITIDRWSDVACELQA